MYMKIREIREKTREELMLLVDERREALRTVRFNIASREAKNHQEHRAIRRDIARILTILHESRA